MFRPASQTICHTGNRPRSDLKISLTPALCRKAITNPQGIYDWVLSICDTLNTLTYTKIAMFKIALFSTLATVATATKLFGALPSDANHDFSQAVASMIRRTRHILPFTILKTLIANKAYQNLHFCRASRHQDDLHQQQEVGR